mmetsp:Transcript_15119/g.34857  ORF Transcript_15119/g.34857 Transcript_15119/m.34857 type:complete len:425 (-) Transcript_15119:67-1341(-)
MAPKEDGEAEEVDGEEGGAGSEEQEKKKKKSDYQSRLDAANEEMNVLALVRKGLQDKIGLKNNQMEYIMKIKQLFDELDTGGFGSLSYQSLQEGLKRACDVDLTLDEASTFFSKYDIHSTDTILPQEFEDMVKELHPLEDHDIGDLKLEYRLRAFFEEADIDHSGTLSVQEIVDGLEAIGMPISEDHLQHIMAAGDDNGDGELDFREFCSLYMRHKASDDYNQEEYDKMGGRWHQDEVIVRDGHPWCRQGQKVVLREHLRSKRGYQRLCGIGFLVRPEPVTGGRWFVKFPCAPEMLMATGRRGNHELQFVLDLLNHQSGSEMQEMQSWREKESDALANAKMFASLSPQKGGDNTPLSVSSEASAVDQRALEEEQHEQDMADYRFRLILARLQADPTQVDPKAEKAAKSQANALAAKGKRQAAFV